MKLKLFTTVVALSVFSLFFAVVFFVTPKAFAARSGIEISPLTFDFSVNPSTTQTGTITVTNLNSTPMNYVVEVENFADVSSNGAPSFAGKEPVDAITTLADWFTFSAPTSGVLEPGKSQSIDFSINIPVDADPGGHYAAIFAREIQKNAQGQTVLGVASRVGSLILVSVPGNVTKTASVSNFVFPKFIWKGPVDFTLQVKNTGSIHYDSTATAVLKSVFGKITNISLGTHTLIPKSEARNYSGTWNKKYPFGYYKVTANAIDGNGNAVTLDGGSVIAIPLLIVIPALIGLVLLLLVIRYLRKHLRFRA